MQHFSVSIIVLPDLSVVIVPPSHLFFLLFFVFFLQNLLLLVYLCTVSRNLFAFTFTKKKLECDTTRVTHYVLQSGFSTTLTTTLSTPVFRGNPPQPVHIWPSSQTSCLWHPTTLTGDVQNDALEEYSGIFGVLKLLSLQLSFDGREQKRVKGGLVRWIWWVGDQLNITGG